MGTTPISEAMPAAVRPTEEPGDARAKRARDARLGSLAWGAFLILSGVLLLIPSGVAPRGSWMMGIGLIMLGLNLARYLAGIPLGRLSTGLGALALLAGVAELLGLDAPLIPLVLVLIGVEVMVSGLRK